MIYLNCDYNEGAHPKVIENIINANNSQEFGYGNDSYSAHAKELIKKPSNALMLKFILWFQAHRLMSLLLAMS